VRAGAVEPMDVEMTISSGDLPHLLPTLPVTLGSLGAVVTAHYGGSYPTVTTAPR
jgi:hypothetical protein